MNNLTKNKVIPVLLVSILLLTSFFVVNPTKASAAKSPLTVNHSSVSINKSGSVNVTCRVNGSLSFSVANSSIISAKWGKWKGNTIKLYFTGKKAGTTKVTVKSTGTKVKRVIKVTCNLIKINLPKTPFYIKNYDYNGSVESTIKITKAWVKYDYYDSYDRETTVKLYVKGQQTYSKHGRYTSTSSWIPWKLYKGRTVVDSEEILTSDISTGEYFTSYDYISDLKGGTYTVKFLNYCW